MMNSDPILSLWHVRRRTLWNLWRSRPRVAMGSGVRWVAEEGSALALVVQGSWQDNHGKSKVFHRQEPWFSGSVGLPKDSAESCEDFVVPVGTASVVSPSDEKILWSDFVSRSFSVSCLKSQHKLKHGHWGFKEMPIKIQKFPGNYINSRHSSR